MENTKKNLLRTRDAQIELYLSLILILSFYRLRYHIYLYKVG